MLIKKLNYDFAGKKTKGGFDTEETPDDFFNFDDDDDDEDKKARQQEKRWEEIQRENRKKTIAENEDKDMEDKKAEQEKFWEEVARENERKHRAEEIERVSLALLLRVPHCCGRQGPPVQDRQFCFAA